MITKQQPASIGLSRSVLHNSKKLLVINSIHLEPPQDLDPNVPIPPNRVRAMIGYHLAWEHNIIAMSMTQGRQRDVVYIGMAIKRMQVEPREASVLTYAQSFYHKVRLGLSASGLIFG